MSRMNGKKTHTHTSSTLLYSSNSRLYPQNPVFEIVHESVKVYLQMYNGNVQQNPLCVESCVTVCVVFSSHSFWTSSSLDVPGGVTQEEGHTGFFIRLLSAVRALFFFARRIQPFLSLVDREVEFCVLAI